jgi:hypothetical protein
MALNGIFLHQTVSPVELCEPECQLESLITMLDIPLTPTLSPGRRRGGREEISNILSSFDFLMLTVYLHEGWSFPQLSPLHIG